MRDTYLALAAAHVFVNHILAVASLAPEVSTGGRVGNPIAADSRVVGVAFSPDGAQGVGENHFRLFAIHQGGDHNRIKRIAAHEPMWPEPPDVARAAARRNFARIRKTIVRRVPALLTCEAFDQLIDLSD
jgi:hypothetical protein